MKLPWRAVGLLTAAVVAGVATAPAAEPPDVVPASPTFTKDVLPIFQKSCQDCHRPGQMAPFSLINISDQEFADLQKEKGSRRTTGAPDRP